MVKFNIRLDKKLSMFVKQLKENLPQTLDTAVRDTTSYGKGLIVRSTAHDTGRTAGGWKTVKEKLMQWKIYNIFKHAQFLETGTGLFGPKHSRIYPRFARFLHWESFRKNTKTDDVFVRSIAGMPAQPAIAPNKDRIQKDLNIRVRNSIRKLWKTAKGTK